MFNTTDKNKKYQYPSEFGLYKCEETNDCYGVRKKTGFNFRYLVVILTSVIVLSSVCVVLYNFVLSSNTNSQPRLVNETDESGGTNLTFSIPDFAFGNDSITNETEPQALEFQNIKRYFPESNIPRPFLYEIRDPKPTGFQMPNNHKPMVYEDNEAAETVAKPIRTRVRNIQDIIKLLTNQNDASQETDNSPNNNNKRGKSRNLKSKRKNSQPFASDPFFPYKPQNPSDINLLATNGLRFAPTIHLDPNPKKKRQFAEAYPNYEKPINSKDSSYQEQPISVTLDLSQQNKRLKKRKPINYPVPFNNNLYNQNQYFNPTINGNRYQATQQYLNKQPYFRPWSHWNLAPNANRQKVRNGIQQTQTSKGQNPMIVHLNLYPKQRRPQGPQGEDSVTEETKLAHHNCSDYYDGYNFAQNKNASEFNQILEHMRHQNTEPMYNGKVTTSTTDKDTEYESKPNVEIQKSVGFTIMNTNFSIPHLTDIDYYTNGESESQWHPITVPADEENMSNARDDRVEESADTQYTGLEVGEVNEASDETVTLPIPKDLFQKYFNTKFTTSKSNEDWDPSVIRQNPNLVNHRATFYEAKNNV